MRLLIKERIEESGMTKVFIANKLGVRRETLDNWIKDNSEPRIRQAIALAKLLHCEVNDLWKDD